MIVQTNDDEEKQNLRHDDKQYNQETKRMKLLQAMTQGMKRREKGVEN